MARFGFNTECNHSYPCSCLSYGGKNYLDTNAVIDDLQTQVDELKELLYNAAGYITMTTPEMMQAIEEAVGKRIP